MKPNYLRCVVFGTLFAACQSGSSAPPASDPGTPTPLVVGPAHSVDFINHAVLAFRASNGVIEGGYRTHDAVVRDGVIAFTPYTFVAGERTGHATATLETSSITMAEALVGGTPTTSLDDGSVVIARGDIVERLTNLVDGLHQEWQFSTGPALDGDLVVDVAVSGYSYVSSTKDGLHFASTDGGMIRYSNALWIDANGKEWPIEPTFDGGHIRMTVPADVLAISAFPARLDPTVGAEQAVDTPVVGPVGTNTQQAAIAFDGTNYLVVWSDNRDSNDADIWGSRVSQAGAVLDPLGIKIATTAGPQSNPVVAFNGSVYVVAWEDFKVHAGTNADIAAATVTTSGAVTSLGAAGVTTNSDTHPVLASRGGGNTLLVWSSAGIVFAAVSSGGAFGPGTVVASGALVEKPGVAANPSGDYLVAYSLTTDLKGQFVTSAGGLNGAAFNISAANGTQFGAAEAFDGTNFDVIWINSNGGNDIYGSRVTTTGMVLDTRLEGTNTVGGIAISTAAGSQQLAALACTASGCLASWQDNRNVATTNFDIFGQLINTDFTLNGGELTIVNANLPQLLPAIAATGSGFFEVWQDDRDGNGNTVFGATVSSAGAVGTGNVIATGNNRESSPHVGVVGGIFGVFWSDSRTYGNDIRFVRFNVNGSKLDAASRVASNAANAQLAPAASGDIGGGNSLVVWADVRNGLNKDIFATRVTLATGAVVDAAGIAISTAANDQLLPDVAANGSGALVVWQDRRTGSFDIMGAIVSSGGAVMVNDIPICTNAGDQVHPSVVWDSGASQFIVVWSDNRSGTSNIYANRVTAAGAVLDGTGVQVSNGAIGQFGPAIATTGNGSFAVWEDRRNAPAGGYNIYGSRLTGGGALTVLDPAGLKLTTAASAQRQDSPTIAFLGTSYVLLYDDDRNVQGDIFGQQITTSGALSGTEFSVAASANNEVNVQMRAYSTNVAILTYESNVLDTSRTEARLLTASSPTGGVCSNASQCQTGFCVDGRCCDTACGGNNTTDCQACRGALTNGPDGTCLPIPSTTICRNYESTYCDLREYCDGVNVTCPADVGRNQGLVCNKSTNIPPGTGTGICPSNAAPGPHFCQ